MIHVSFPANELH